ncbi:MAG: hypothetical protein V4736_13500 [Bdellovibrionota bacterium]
MKHIFFLLITLVLSSHAIASFGRIDCSSTDGQVKYNFRFPVNQDSESIWTIDGKKFTEESGLVSMEPLTERTPLEKNETQMTASSTYVYKVKLTQLDAPEGKVVKTIEAWLLCFSASGI